MGKMKKRKEKKKKPAHFFCLCVCRREGGKKKLHCFRQLNLNNSKKIINRIKLVFMTAILWLIFPQYFPLFFLFLSRKQKENQK